MKYFRRLMLAANLALLGLILLSAEIIQAAPLSGQGGASTDKNDSLLWIAGILVAVILISSLALLVLRRRPSK